MTTQEKKPLKPYTFTVTAVVHSTDPKRAKKLLTWALWSAGITAESAEKKPAP